MKSLENSSLTVPTIETNNKYYQIAIPEGPTIRIYFVNQSIIRVRVCFDKNPLFDEQSYALVMTAWEDRFDDVLKNIRRRIKPLINVSFQEVETESEGKYYYF